ncbi:MFS transporter [Mycena chlorophos]|nr:MFS transporter [Mycena chlorophos]
MGNLIWHDLARFISITASAYGVWASFFALFYRKFFWDFVSGTLRDPGGLQPANSDAIFITLIVKFPVIPIITAIIALINLAIENPLPMLKGSSIQRSLVVRVVVLVFQAFFAVFFYQGTNVTLWSLVGIFCYVRAIALGEKIEEAKANRGKGGRA